MSSSTGPRRKGDWAPVTEKPKPGDMVNVQIATGVGGHGRGRGEKLPAGPWRRPGNPGIEELVMESRAGEPVERR